MFAGVITNLNENLYGLTFSKFWCELCCPGENVIKQVLLVTRCFLNVFLTHLTLWFKSLPWLSVFLHFFSAASSATVRVLGLPATDCECLQTARCIGIGCSQHGSADNCVGLSGCCI